MIASLVLKGYFSDGVIAIIKAQSKLSSQAYIEKIIKEEIVDKNYDFFYDTVSTDGVLVCSFDVNKANSVLSETLRSLKTISEAFSEEIVFEVNIPVSYLFIPSSYLLPSVKLNVETSSLLYYNASIKTDVEDYGINNSLVTLSLEINIAYQVIVPLMFEVVDNHISIPLAVEIINGRVPEGLFLY